MQTKLFKIPLITLALLGLVLPTTFLSQKSTPALATETTVTEESLVEESILLEGEFPVEPSIPSRIEETGTYFEIKDSEYLNISLKSTEEIKVILESIPRMISLDISSSTDSTHLTISGLEPNKTYYKYENSYKNEAVFISDENCSYSWTQDLSQPYHIWLQEEKGTTYISEDTVLYDDIVGSVEITADNITLDCNGHKITGSSSGSGIHIYNKANIIIKNCTITNFYYGIYLAYSSKNTISNTTTTNNYHGFLLVSSKENILANNVVNSNKYQGIYLSYSNKNSLAGNVVYSNGYNGIYLSYSSNNTLLNNNASNNLNYDGISISGSNDNDIKDNVLNYNRLGIGQWSSKNNIIKNNTSTYNRGHGIYLQDSQDNILTDNISLNNNSQGVVLYNSNQNTLENNELTYNRESGIYLYDSDRNQIINNNASNSRNYHGIVLGGFSNNENIIKNNTIHNNVVGIYFSDSAFNKVIENDISNNKYGIYLYSGGYCCWGFEGTSFCNYCTSYNYIYHNNFKNNTSYQLLNHSLGSNYFHNGYPIDFDLTKHGGNYWSDYTEVDQYSGPNQDQPGSDGIGDAPYTFPGGQDRYPFMKESGWEVPAEPEKWSFAIITDLHIGRGYPDYDGTSYEENGEGEDYYLPERLKKVVNWINENKNKIDCEEMKCPIKFLAVLGDIADTAEKSEFLRVKSILDKLNDPNQDGTTTDGIPYLVVFGNHDVWPYTDFEEAKSVLGEKYFSEIFWCKFENLEEEKKCKDENINLKLIESDKFFGNSWKRDKDYPKYKNYAFSYGEINFIGLDFSSRKPAPFGPGVGSDAVRWEETTNWLKDCLKDYKECLKGYEGNPSIIFSHHPLVKDLKYGFSSDELDKISTIIKENNVIASFGGHIHGFEKFLGVKDIFKDANEAEYPSIDGRSVSTTEALMVGSNEKDEYLKEHDKGIIKIVKIFGENEIDYKTNEGKYNPQTGEEKEFIALNPYMDYDYQSLSGEPCMIFKGHAFTKRENSLSWEIDNKIIGSGEKVEYCFSEVPKTYKVKLTTIDKEKPEIKEEIAQKIEVKAGIIPRLLKIGDEAAEKIEIVSTTLWEDLTKTGRTIKDTVLIKVKHSEAKPVGLITVNFEQATEDIDLSNLTADINLDTKKSILYMLDWPDEIEKGKVLFIPYSATGTVYICPNAISLNEVNPKCSDKINLNLGETVNGLTLSTTTYEDQDYYLVFGFTNGGGGVNLSPEADASGPYQGDEGSPITFNAGNSTDPNNDPLQYRWDFNNDGIWDTEWLNESTTTYTWGDDWQGQAKLEVNDGEFTDIDVVEVEILNVSPIVETGQDQEIIAGDIVYFNGSFTDPGWLDTHTIVWDFGNGNIMEETLTPTRIFYNKGTYNITLTITDDDGGTGIDTLKVTVKPILATIDLDPDALNLKSKGEWVTAYIELLEGYNVSLIDISKVVLNGVISAETDPNYGFVKNPEIKDRNGDGLPELMVKFNRETVQALLSPGEKVTVTIAGKVFYNNGLADFEGFDIIRVIK